MNDDNDDDRLPQNNDLPPYSKQHFTSPPKKRRNHSNQIQDHFINLFTPPSPFNADGSILMFSQFDTSSPISILFTLQNTVPPLLFPGIITTQQYPIVIVTLSVASMLQIFTILRNLVIHGVNPMDPPIISLITFFVFLGLLFAFTLTYVASLLPPAQEFEVFSADAQVYLTQAHDAYTEYNLRLRALASSASTSYTQYSLSPSYTAYMNQTLLPLLLPYIPQPLLDFLFTQNLHQFLISGSFVADNYHLLIYSIPGLSERELLRLINMLPEDRRDRLLRPGYFGREVMGGEQVEAVQDLLSGGTAAATSEGTTSVHASPLTVESDEVYNDMVLSNDNDDSDTDEASNVTISRVATPHAHAIPQTLPTTSTTTTSANTNNTITTTRSHRPLPPYTPNPPQTANTANQQVQTIVHQAFVDYVSSTSQALTSQAIVSSVSTSRTVGLSVLRRLRPIFWEIARRSVGLLMLAVPVYSMPFVMVGLAPGLSTRLSLTSSSSMSSSGSTRMLNRLITASQNLIHQTNYPLIGGLIVGAVVYVGGLGVAGGLASEVGEEYLVDLIEAEEEENDKKKGDTEEGEGRRLF